VLQRGIAGITAEDLKNKRTETNQRRSNLREAQIRYAFSRPPPRRACASIVPARALPRRRCSCVRELARVASFLINLPAFFLWSRRLFVWLPLLPARSAVSSRTHPVLSLNFTVR
jgi:hypothetical protein